MFSDKITKFRIFIFLALLSGCAERPPSDVRAWLADRTDLEWYNHLLPDLNLSLKTKSEHAFAALDEYLARYKNTKQLGPLEEVKLPGPETAYVFHATENKIEGFVFLYRYKHGNHISWCHDFFPRNYFDIKPMKTTNKAVVPTTMRGELVTLSK